MSANSGKIIQPWSGIRRLAEWSIYGSTPLIVFWGGVWTIKGLMIDKAKNTIGKQVNTLIK